MSSETVLDQLLQYRPLNDVLARIAAALEGEAVCSLALVVQSLKDAPDVVIASESGEWAVEAFRGWVERHPCAAAPQSRYDGSPERLPLTEDECPSLVAAGYNALSRHPVTDGKGEYLGSLCLLHTSAHPPHAEHGQRIREYTRLAGVAMAFHGVLRRAEHEALHDGLTGLSNRRGLLAILRSELGTAADPPATAVVLLDVDGFKAVNDSHGHGVGDSVLTVIADRILAAVRPDDAVARLGGDEFVVIMRQVDPANAEQVARRILTSLRAPFRVEHLSLHLTPSMGLAFAQDFPGASAERLLDEADGAMYQAKREGKDGIRLASSQQAKRRPDAGLLEIVTDPGSLDAHLVIGAWPRWYDRELVGRQLLMQWRDQGSGELHSLETLLQQIDSRDVRMRVQDVARQAVRDRLDPAWFAQGRRVAVRPPRAALLDPAYPAFLEACLREKGARAEQMELEMTGILGDPLPRIRNRVDALRDHMPDLGFSMRTLEHNPLSLEVFDAVRPDVLRISPRTFLSREGSWLNAETVMRSMLTLADACGARVVADQVATRQEYELARSAGVRCWQGPLESGW